MAQTGPANNARVLKVAAPWEIGSLDPSKTGYIFTRLEVTETLVDVDGSGQLAPGLAVRWAVSPDQKTWRFALRPGAVFHDGSAVSPEAVVRSLQRALSQPGILKNTPVQRIAAVNGEVQIELKQAFTALPAFLAHNSTQVLAPASFAADNSVQAVVGSGPYKVVRINAPQKLETATFEGWTGKRPAVQRVEYLATGRGETRGMLAESGQADLVFTHDAVAIERLKRNPRLQFHTLPIPRTRCSRTSKCARPSAWRLTGPVLRRPFCGSPKPQPPSFSAPAWPSGMCRVCNHLCATLAVPASCCKKPAGLPAQTACCAKRAALSS
jgi:peptide/nickel transport system substrate-binding protein